jgi:hypothetical protein
MSSSAVLQQLRRQCGLPRVPTCRRPCAVVTASAKQDRAATTINSLDDLLGSRDEEPVDFAEQEQGSSWRPIQLLRVPGECCCTGGHKHMIRAAAALSTQSAIYHTCMQGWAFKTDLLGEPWLLTADDAPAAATDAWSWCCCCMLLQVGHGVKFVSRAWRLLRPMYYTTCSSL